MAEIKSTLDLVLEKTKDLTLTEEEKSRLRHEELIRRAESFARRYGNEEISLNHLLMEISRERESEDQRIIKQAMTNSLVNIIALDRPNHRILEVLPHLMKEGNSLIPKFEALQKDYVKTREAHYSRIANVLSNEFARRGITGSAVVPKVASSSAWHEAASVFEREFQRKLERIKTSIVHHV